MKFRRAAAWTLAALGLALGVAATSPPWLRVTNADPVAHTFSARLGGDVVGPVNLRPGETRTLHYRIQRDSNIWASVNGEPQQLDAYVGGTHNCFTVTLREESATLETPAGRRC